MNDNIPVLGCQDPDGCGLGVLFGGEPRMASTSAWPGLSRCRRAPAFLQRGAVVARVAQVGVGAVGQQPLNAGGTPVSCRDVQRQPPPFGIGLVDRGPGRDQLVDDRQSLVVGGELQRPDPAFQGEPGQRPAGDVAAAAACSRLRVCPGSHQDVDDLGHPEHAAC